MKTLFVPFLYTLISELSAMKSVEQCLLHLAHRYSFLLLFREREIYGIATYREVNADFQEPSPDRIHLHSGGAHAK